jgi:hypothetical protein
MFELFTRRTQRIHELARAQDAHLPELPASAFTLHTGGVDEMIREWLRTHHPRTLPELAEPVLAATFALFGDRTR